MLVMYWWVKIYCLNHWSTAVVCWRFYVFLCCFFRISQNMEFPLFLWTWGIANLRYNEKRNYLIQFYTIVCVTPQTTLIDLTTSPVTSLVNNWLWKVNIQHMYHMTKENRFMFHCVSYHQLLHPLGENSPIAGFLKKKADGGIHHICIEVRQ